MTLHAQQAPAAADRAVPAYRMFDVTVREARVLTPHLRRVTFTGADLDLFGDTCLDQRVKVVLPLPGTGEPFAHLPRGTDWYAEWRRLPEPRRNPFRTYTARAVRPAAAEVDLDFVAHGDGGPASRWASRARPGDPAVLVGPDARGDSARVGVEWRPGAAREVLLAGDETAVPAICSIVESLPAGMTGQAFLEVPTAADRLAVRAPAGLEVHWLPRAQGAHGLLLREAVRELTWIRPADGTAYAWLAGEASAVRALRRHLVRERGWDRRQVTFMGYWRAGHPEV